MSSAIKPPAEQPAVTDRRVWISGSEQAVLVSRPSTILEALQEQGIDYPHGCTTGFCGMCKSRLISGKVEHSNYYGTTLSEEELSANLILPCCAKPLTDCVIAPVVALDDLPAAESFSAEIRKLSMLTHDIRRVRLKPLVRDRFNFLAGQYASLEFSGLPVRDFSMASVPEDDDVEFFIRRIGGGTVTNYVCDRVSVGDVVTVTGPFGLAYLRHPDESPFIAVAGGSGLAPILSIVRSAISKGMRQPIHVYFGVRSERDLYLEADLCALRDRYSNLSVEISLSDSSGPTCRRVGHIHDVLDADFRGRDLSKFRAYVAGPPIMTNAVEGVLKRFGLANEHWHADPFLTAADRSLRSPT